MDTEPTPDVENDNSSPQPTLAEMTQRRFLVVSTPNGNHMRSYYQLELLEDNIRARSRRSYSKPLDMWNRFLNLFSLAFSRAYEWDESTTATESKARTLAMDLLALAGTTSKPTIDALVDGYYSQAYALLRSLLETWRRVVYLRLDPEIVESWFPDEQPAIDTPGEGLIVRPPSAKKIAAAIGSSGSHELESQLELIRSGIESMHVGSHPSLEGTTRLWGDAGKRYFGPTYKPTYLEFGLQWGLIALLFLAAELHTQFSQADDWANELQRLNDEVRMWVQETSDAQPK